MKLFIVPFLVFQSILITIIRENSNYKIFLAKADTLLVEDIDASDFVLSYQFKYVKNDTAESNRLRDEQTEFLRKMGIPASGFEEISKNSSIDFNKLIDNYGNTIRQLKNHPYKDLYRQAASQLLVKHFCSDNIISEAYLNSPHNKLLYFLKEMKASGGVNLGLIYTSFLKFQYNNKYSDLCDNLVYFIPYCEEKINENQETVNSLKLLNDTKHSPFDTFIYEDLFRRLETEKEYLSKLNKFKRIVCGKNEN